MTRRDWVWALAATLGVGPMPGCMHVLQTNSNDRPPAPVEQTASAKGSPPMAEAAGATSPYSMLPPPPPEPVGCVTATVIPPAQENNQVAAEQAVHYPTESNSPVALPPATPMSSETPSPLPVPPGSPVPRVDSEPEPALVAALRCLMEKRPEDAAARLGELDKANREVLLCLLPLAVRLSQGALDRAAASELTVMVDQVEGAAAPLRQRAPLAIDKMCFCRRIDKFGQYEPLPDRRQFRPGELVQVYAELRNFSSNPGQAGFETRLASSVRLTRHTTDREEIVWRQDFHDRDRVDRGRSPRRDYFNNYRFCVPENIPPGTYKLWLKVVDVPTGRSAESSLPLMVRARTGP